MSIRIGPGVARGFTLLEVLVVTVIVGLLAGAAVLSVSALDGDRQATREAQRLVALLELAGEEAILQGREIGVEFLQDGYRFYAYSISQGIWLPLSGQRPFRARSVPQVIRITLRLEGRTLALEREARDPPRPQVVLSASGETTAFVLDLQPSAGGLVRVRLDAAGRVQVERP